MNQRWIIFAVFAAAVLFSMVREWRAPAACPRIPAAPADVARLHR